MFKIGLGSEVQDKITGFRGIVSWRCEYSTGCVRYGVQPQKLDKATGKPRESESFDEVQLVVLKKADVTKAKWQSEAVPDGGPMPSPKRAPDPR